MQENKKSPFEKVNLNGVNSEERKKLADPNYKSNSELNTGKMETINKTFGSGSENKDPEDKVYIIFVVSVIGRHYCSYIVDTKSMVDGEYAICEGRTDAYNYIRDLLESDGDANIDIEQSMVLVEGVSCTNMITMLRFMKHCEQFFPDDEFDIEEYIDREPLDDIPSNQQQATGNSDLMSSMILNQDDKEEKNNG